MSGNIAEKGPGTLASGLLCTEGLCGRAERQRNTAAAYELCVDASWQAETDRLSRSIHGALKCIEMRCFANVCDYMRTMRHDRDALVIPGHSVRPWHVD